MAQHSNKENTSGQNALLVFLDKFTPVILATPAENATPLVATPNISLILPLQVHFPRIQNGQ
jgi:hypothetical protein